MLHSFVSDQGMIFEDRAWIWERYGTAYRAMYTLFEAWIVSTKVGPEVLPLEEQRAIQGAAWGQAPALLRNWPVSARPVLNKVSHVYVFFFVLYITLVVFAVIRVISAVFLKDTLDAAQNDMQQQVVDKVLKKTEFVNKLEGIFRAIDENGTGMISEERLTHVLGIPKVAAYFQTMELEVHEGQALFKVLQNGNGEVTLEEFIDGILRCKGPARAIDQVAMHADLRDIDASLGIFSAASGTGDAMVKKIGRLAALMIPRDTVSSMNSEELGIQHRREHLKVLRIHDTNGHFFPPLVFLGCRFWGLLDPATFFFRIAWTAESGPCRWVLTTAPGVQRRRYHQSS
eukprot:s2078_g1.t1